MERFGPDLLRPELEVALDASADAMYISLHRNAEFARGEDIDTERHVDYDASDRPIGVALLDLQGGVDVAGLPEAELVQGILRGHSVVVFDSTKHP